MQEMIPGFPIAGGYERPQGSHENMLNSQANLALDVSVPKLNILTMLIIMYTHTPYTCMYIKHVHR